MALAGEDPRVELVVLEPQRLDAGDERLECEGDRVAAQEHERAQDDADRAAPERARGLEHDQPERRMHETEGSEPRERDEVREEPDDGVEELDAGLGQRRGAVPGLEHEADSEEHEADAADDRPGDLEREELRVDTAGEEQPADEDHQPRDAELAEQRLPEAAAPAAVHDAEQVADRQQHRADSRGRRAAA